MSKNARIIIAGGGIAGLALALALLRRGIPAQVHEQVAVPGEVGAGLQISPNATRCLFSLGLEDAVRRVVTVPEGKEVRLWNTGQRWKLFDLGASSEQAFGFPYVMIHRGDLHQLLLDAVLRTDPQAVRTGSRCTGFQQDADGVTVLFEDGSTQRCEALIGADGVHSRVRGAMFGQQPAVFTGCMAWRGLIPADRLPAGFVRPMGVNWIGPGSHIVTYPLRGGQLFNFVGVVERDDWQVESWTESGTTAECARDFAGWHDDVQVLIQRIEKPFKWALMGRKPLSHYAQGRVTLMGDAAHPTLPFLAQGAGMALEDAVVLARSIDAHGHDVPTALLRYEQARIERTARIVSGSSDNIQRFHNATLASPVDAQRFVDDEWSEDKVRARYHWLFEYDALTAPVVGTAEAAAAQ